MDGGDFKGLRDLQDSAKARFLRGLVFYSGDQSIVFGTDLWAVPISALWHWQCQSLDDSNEA